MIDKFVDQIIKNSLPPPTNSNFSIEKWNEEWKKIAEEATAKDATVYKAGLIINSLLSEIRENLKDLYKQAPKITPEDLILAFVSLSNRDITVALKQASQSPPNSIYSTKVESNNSESSHLLQEIAHGVVDGVQLAIRSSLDKQANNREIKESKNPIDELEFVLKEHALSQLYSSYTHLWQCILWSNYELSLINEQSKIYSISQRVTPYEIAFEKSAIRQNKIHSQKLTIAYSASITQPFINEKFVIIKRKNKNRVATAVRFKNHEEKLKIFNNIWHLDVFDLKERFPDSWFESGFGKGFCIDEALEVMRCLRLLALDISDKFPTDDSFYNTKKLLEFCPRVGAASLLTALQKATDIGRIKIQNILDFLTAKHSPKGDLWCEPLLKIKNEYAILVSAIAHPNITRLIEHWIQSFGQPLDEKGYSFEKFVLSSFNKKIVSNELAQDYSLGITKRIRLPSGEEEFDLLARIDDLILLGECKSIITTDSEISKYRTAETLESASQQIIRKTFFLKQNIQSIFNELGWTFDPHSDYKIVGFIVNSGRIFVGHNFNGIPVVDEMILNAYFDSPKIRILSVPRQGKEVKDVAWYQLYTNLKELKENFPIYLSDPPQLLFRTGNFEYKDFKIPCINESSFKIMKRSLVPKQLTPSQIMMKEHKFTVCKSDDYEEEISTIQVIL